MVQTNITQFVDQITSTCAEFISKLGDSLRLVCGEQIHDDAPKLEVAEFVETGYAMFNITTDTLTGEKMIQPGVIPQTVYRTNIPMSVNSMGNVTHGYAMYGATNIDVLRKQVCGNAYREYIDAMLSLAAIVVSQTDTNHRAGYSIGNSGYLRDTIWKWTRRFTESSNGTLVVCMELQYGVKLRLLLVDATPSTCAEFVAGFNQHARMIAEYYHQLERVHKSEASCRSTDDIAAQLVHELTVCMSKSKFFSNEYWN